MSQLTYERELALLADELQADDASLSRADALKQAREAMTELYRTALDWNQRAAAQRSQRTSAA